jgi:hypothetical protein
MIPLYVYFSFKIPFKLEFFKMLSIRVRFSSGFPLVGGFPAEQFLLCGIQFCSVGNKMCRAGAATTADQHPCGALRE